jgi:lysophospholipase L1-like esterase
VTVRRRQPRRRGRRVVLARGALGALAVLAVAMAGGVAPAGASGPAGSARARNYYVSLGDSYSIGYQPAPSAGPTAGYTAVVAQQTGLTLANFGCAGATTTSLVNSPGCAPPTGIPAGAGRVAYGDETQLAAALSFIRLHRGHIGLITVSIGGNDITRCASTSNPIACVTSAVLTVSRNVATIAHQLRAAAGERVPLLGLTYPDVLLGLWVYPPGAASHALATLSVTAFKSLFNPALSRAYQAAGGTLVDVTKDAGSYVPLSQTTTLAPYGTVPVAVARTCQLSWYCARGNIHATTAGYRLIGAALVTAYRGEHHS